MGGTSGWHRKAHYWAQVSALLDTGGRTAGHRWVDRWVALLGTDHRGT
ncbi:unnamed protein product, partial [Staurois parvus]